jgi:hypothetical protein
MHVAADTPMRPVVNYSITPANEIKAIMKSNTFHFSKKYLLSRAIILIIASSEKIPVKLMFM